ncbi:aspartate aminotransferase [candidate division LCP-89 bacterium B3_LCP]|uniref:Aminotransferase n=1 Tax=candidate division LCP-89 bacterium B3_LCP TaxID=2012998 RepID=A0A532V0A3_UNCL8|nr:MAG: aspartate aminotransferase [candidate division LCP-89 bacterium B3_LCP]
MKEKYLAQRIQGIEPSGIRKIFDRVPQAKNPINLTMGEPDFDVPDRIKQAARNAMDQGYNKYTPTQGIPPLRQAIAEHLRERGFPFEEILVTAGVSGGLVLSTLSLVNPGDEVLIPDPYFVMYKYMIRLAGGKPVFLDTYPDFKLKPEVLEKAITPRTKFLILNYPNNPTGAVLSASEMDDIAEIVRKHNIFVVSDEIYDHMIYDNQDHESISTRDVPTLILGGFSKTFGMTGWRLGYAAGPAWLVRQMTIMQQYSFTSANSVAQYATLEAFSCDMSGEMADLAKRRDFIFAGLCELGFEPSKPGGALYIFAPVPEGETGDAFVERCIAKELFVIPGGAFSQQDTHFRLSFAASTESLTRALEVLEKLVK